MQQTTTAQAATLGNRDEDEYEQFVRLLSKTLEERTEEGNPLFTTNATPEQLWEAYLSGFPEGPERQYHNCNHCRHFIQRFGGLVTITDGGELVSAFWPLQRFLPDEYKAAVSNVLFRLRGSRVTGVFLESERVWGVPSNVSGSGVTWKHMHLRPPERLIYTERLKTAWQAMAEKREDKKNVSRALREFGKEQIRQVVALLQSDSLYGGEKVLGPASFLLELHEACDMGANRENVIWKAIALAPAGFCHPRSSMVGTLLDDLASGKPFEKAAASFRDKMHPLKYQRPKAAPSDGAIDAAEKAIEKLGIAKSLERRFARLDELETIWRSPEKPEVESTGGSVFDHLRKNRRSPETITTKHGKITFARFRDEVLPRAERIEVRCGTVDNYGAIVTALDPEAPPIIRWDHEERRNPFSWYLWYDKRGSVGSHASQWGLVGSSWVECPAVTLYPGDWHADEPTMEAAMFVLEGARETKLEGNSLFPEILKSELHPYRSVIEAFSKKAVIHGAPEGSACGIVTSILGLNVRVTVGTVVTEYVIDRWR